MVQDSLHLLQIIDPDSHFTAEICTLIAAFYIRNDNNDNNNIVISHILCPCL